MRFDLGGIDMIMIIIVAAAFALQLFLLFMTKRLALRLIPVYLLALTLVVAWLFLGHIIVEEGGGFIDAGALMGALILLAAILWAGGAAAAWIVWGVRYLIRKYRDGQH